MKSICGAIAMAVIASSASGQPSFAACADIPDTAARQTIVSAGSLKVCLLALRADPEDSTPRQWATRSHVVILETQQPGDFRRLALDRGSAFTVNGKPAAVDSAAELWQRVVIDVLDAAWAAKRLGEMADDLRTSDIPLPTNADSARARLAGLEKQIKGLQSKSARADAEVARAQREPSLSPSRELVDAIAESRRLQAERDTLTRRKDLLMLQLERLDPTNPHTIARQSMADEVASRRATVEATLDVALSRLLALLMR